MFVVIIKFSIFRTSRQGLMKSLFMIEIISLWTIWYWFVDSPASPGAIWTRCSR